MQLSAQGESEDFLGGACTTGTPQLHSSLIDCQVAAASLHSCWPVLGAVGFEGVNAERWTAALQVHAAGASSGVGYNRKACCLTRHKLGRLGRTMPCHRMIFAQLMQLQLGQHSTLVSHQIHGAACV